MDAPRPQGRETTHHHIGGDFNRRPLFDDKVVSADNTKYSDGKKNEWLRTATNYCA